MATRHDADPQALIAARQREAVKPGRQKLAGRGSGLTPRVKQAIEFLVFGDDSGETLRLDDAADKAGITGRTLRAALLKPAVDAFYSRQVAAYRNGERAASFRKIVEIRDDPLLGKSPAGMKVALDAAKTMAFDPPGQSQVNVQVNNNVTVTPGYVIDLSPEPNKHGAKVIDDIVTANG